MGMALGERAAREDSDVIAHVRIVTTTPPSDGFLTGKDPAKLKIDSFSRIATARVVSAVKGCKEGDTLALAFDNGFGCPNIHYTEKEECLVFLKKRADGVYLTMNLYCGRFTIEADKVLHFSLMHPFGQAPEAVPLAAVLAWLRTAPAKPAATP